MPETNGGDLNLWPIGVVHSPLQKTGTREKKRAEIEIFERFLDGLMGIEAYSELLALFWMNRLEEKDRDVLIVYPKGDKTRPRRGVFSTRSPRRPNPLGITRVRLVKRAGNSLTVEGLDAVDGTPVIDIKKVDSDY